MKKGRINERNLGKHKLDGGAKNTKRTVISDDHLTEDQRKIKEAILYCEKILKDGIKLYDTTPKLVQFWIDNGTVIVRKVENSYAPIRPYKPFEKRAFLNEAKRSDVELVYGLLLHVFKS